MMDRVRCGAIFALFILVPIIGLAQVSQVHLGWSENNVYETMTVMWYSPMSGNQRVLYDELSHPAGSGYAFDEAGTDHTIQPSLGSDGNLITTKPFAGNYYVAHLTGLKPGTTYYFRVKGAGPSALTQEWSFRTIAEIETIEFAFAGDSQRPFEIGGVDCAQLISRPAAPANWPYMRNFITQKAADLEPDFFLGLGDFVSRGNNQDQWNNWFDAWQDYAVTPTGRMIPMVPVVGNHEMGGYPNIDASYEWFLGLFAIPQPLPGMPCYSLDFPNLHLTVLAATSGQIETNQGLANYEAERQVPWLEGDLMSAKAQDAPWRLVAFHYNYLGCFLACTGYPSDEYTSVWNQFLQNASVDAVFMGHTHNYTRSWPVWLGMPNPCFGGSLSYQLMAHSDLGTTYIVHGGWGGVTSQITHWPGFSGGCQLRDWLAAAASHPSLGFAQLDDATCGFRVEDTSGFVIDEFQLPYVPDYNDVPTYTEMVP